MRRLDPRIRWTDITMRMERRNRPNENALNMLASRSMRPLYKMLSWHTKGRVATINTRRAAVLAQLTPAQIAANTTRGSTPGLINPALGEIGGRIPHPVLRTGQGVQRGSRRPRSEATTSSSDDEVSVVRQSSIDDKSCEGEEKQEENEGETDSTVSKSDKSPYQTCCDVLSCTFSRTRIPLQQSRLVTDLPMKKVLDSTTQRRVRISRKQQEKTKMQAAAKRYWVKYASSQPLQGRSKYHVLQTDEWLPSTC